MCDSAEDLVHYASLVDDTVKVKKAAIVAVFILYIIYLVGIIAKYGF